MRVHFDGKNVHPFAAQTKVVKTNFRFCREIKSSFGRDKIRRSKGSWEKYQEKIFCKRTFAAPVCCLRYFMLLLLVVRLRKMFQQKSDRSRCRRRWCRRGSVGVCDCHSGHSLQLECRRNTLSHRIHKRRDRNYTNRKRERYLLR